MIYMKQQIYKKCQRYEKIAVSQGAVYVFLKNKIPLFLCREAEHHEMFLPVTAYKHQSGKEFPQHSILRHAESTGIADGEEH
ncbi:hypothetical protein T11_1454 [Trichinella zimbabwensis]|uniref:Uncharacterized protein n=1 Tax=Trichinella zimbabwensis TaxID=268475 RepID=A0A0V1H0I8_9BILA|nr:hypothetical protein T11_9446 [Trichinella zimbabwensis]KRZ04063.1 hypothetical protein T11_1454 [Trichinella zimbabwensis]